MPSREEIVNFYDEAPDGESPSVPGVVREVGVEQQVVREIYHRAFVATGLVEA